MNRGDSGFGDCMVSKLREGSWVMGHDLCIVFCVFLVVPQTARDTNHHVASTVVAYSLLWRSSFTPELMY